MKKPILEMSEDELRDTIQERHERRAIRPNVKPKRITVRALSQAWGISEQRIIEELLK